VLLWLASRCCCLAKVFDRFCLLQSLARACFWVSKACVCKLWGSGGPHPYMVSVCAIIVHLMSTPLVVWLCFVLFARWSCFGFLGLDMWLFWDELAWLFVSFSLLPKFWFRLDITSCWGFFSFMVWLAFQFLFLFQLLVPWLFPSLAFSDGGICGLGYWVGVFFKLFFMLHWETMGVFWWDSI